nr:hypothetical protein [uncultured Sphaerochaeta sp.]
MYDFTIQYDEKKWKEIEDGIHQIYSNHPDPRSAEASYSVASVISDAFPSINFNEAMRNAPQIVEKFTGHKLDTNNIFTEFGNTFKAQSKHLKTSMDYSNAMLLAAREGQDSDKFKARIHELIEEERLQPPSYRNDYKDMSIFSDLLVESARLAPSALPTIGIYAAGGMLAPFTGGASLAAARGLGAAYSGMMEAGSVVKELIKAEDELGNKLDDDYILSAWGLTMAGMTALNFATSGFEKVIGTSAETAMKNVFNKGAVKKLVQSGAVRNWGRKVLTDYVGKGIVGESIEEALEEFIGMFVSNYEMDKSNQEKGTLFKEKTREEIVDSMKQVALSTSKGMVFGGLLAPLSSAVSEYKRSDTGTKRNANKFTKPTDESVTVDMSEIKYKEVSADKNIDKVDAPIKVMKIGDSYKPVDETAAVQAASLKKNGARALNVEVVGSQAEFNKDSVSAAMNFARSMQYDYKDGVVLFDDAEAMQEAARAYSLKFDSVKGYQEQDGQIVIDRENDNGTHKLVFQTKDFHQQNEGLYTLPEDMEPIQAPAEPGTEPLIETKPEENITRRSLQEEATMLEGDEAPLRSPQPSMKPEEVVKREYSHFQRTLKRKGATDTEQRYINDTLLPKIHDVMKQQFPNMSESEVYHTAIPSSYFAFVASKVAGMTTDEFFGKHFTPEAFVALTAKDQQSFLKSQAGKKSIEIQTGDSANEATLFGLTIPKKGKNTIGIGSSYSPLTVVHEMGHVMVKVIKDTDQFKPFMEIYKDQLTQDGGKVGVNFQEAFAKDLEQYFIDGKVRDSSLKTIFQKISDGIRELLHLLNPMLDNETRKAFDKLFDFKLEETAKADTKATAPQMELDLFGDPESVVESLGKIGTAEENNTQLGTDPFDSSQILAKISSAVSLDQIKSQLANNEYPADRDLMQHAGDPDVDWEIQFRRIMLQDPDVFKAFNKALDTAMGDAGDTEVTAEQVLKVLGEQNKDKADSMLEEVGDSKRFVERLMWQSKFVGPTRADKIFYTKLSNPDFMADVLKVLLANHDPANEYYRNRWEHEKFMRAYYDGTLSGYMVRKIKEDLRFEIREVRRKYLGYIGEIQQLSYEDAVEGTYLDDGLEVEAFGNEEIRNLMEDKNTDPVLKELIRKNLATGDVLQKLVEETTAQIGQLQMEVMDAEGKADQAIDNLDTVQGKFDDLENEFGKQQRKYKKLQKTNTKNYENFRMMDRLNKTKAKRIQYLKAQRQLEKSLSSIKTIAHSNSNANDGRIMFNLKTAIDALFSTKGEDLTFHFADKGLKADAIPDALKPFFTVDVTGIHAKNIEKEMDLTDVFAIHQAVKEVRNEAKIEKAARDAQLNKEVFGVARDYAHSTRGAWFKTDAERKAYMSKELLENEVTDAKNKGLSFFERNFLTMTRLINKIDPEGNTIKPYILGGKDKNGVFHRGIEGVIDDEKREEFRRYSEMRKVMKSLKIKENDLLKEHIVLSNSNPLDANAKTVTKKLTVQQAMGVYIFAKQPDAYSKLTSPHGNKFLLIKDDQGNVLVNEVQQVIDSLSADQKAFANYMLKDMASRWSEIDEVYYRIMNKRLGMIADYWPLVRVDMNKSIDDLMEDQFLRMQELPDDSNTRERIGGDYMLNLDAFSIWSKMVPKQEHYIAGAEYFHKVNRLLNKNGGDVYNLIAMNVGKDYATSLQDYLNRVARKRHIYEDADTLLNKVRSNLVVARLGFNMLTVLKQLPALGLFAMEFGPIRLFEAITHMTTDYKGTCEFIYDKSPQMRNHGMSIDFNSFMQMEAKTKPGRVVKKIGEAGMTPIQFVDGIIKNTLWYGAYQNNIAKGMDPELAAMEATKWINDTQPGGTAKDSAAIYETNSTALKYLLMFTNQLNKNLNIMYDIPHQLKNKMLDKVIRNVIGLGLSLAGIVALEGGFKDGDDDDDDFWNEVLTNFAAQIVSMVPIAGPEVSDYMRGRFYSDSGIPLISDGLSLVSAMKSGKPKRIKDRTVNLGLGFMEFTGLPAGQMNKIWDAFTEDGEFNPWYLLGRDFIE